MKKKRESEGLQSGGEQSTPRGKGEMQVRQGGTSDQASGNTVISNKEG